MGDSALAASFWAMLGLQTLSAVDMPGRGARKLPSPRAYVAALVAWGILFLISDKSPRASRATAAIGWLMVSAAFTLGPFGKQLISFLTTVAVDYGPSTTNSQQGGNP